MDFAYANHPLMKESLRDGKVQAHVWALSCKFRISDPNKYLILSLSKIQFLVWKSGCCQYVDIVAKAIAWCIFVSSGVASSRRISLYDFAHSITHSLPL